MYSEAIDCDANNIVKTEEKRVYFLVIAIIPILIMPIYYSSKRFFARCVNEKLTFVFGKNRLVLQSGSENYFSIFERILSIFSLS